MTEVPEFDPRVGYVLDKIVPYHQIPQLAMLIELVDTWTQRHRPSMHVRADMVVPEWYDNDFHFEVDLFRTLEGDYWPVLIVASEHDGDFLLPSLQVYFPSDFYDRDRVAAEDAATDLRLVIDDYLFLLGSLRDGHE